MVEFMISLLYWGLWAMLFLTVAFLVTAGYFVFQRVANWVATFEGEEPKPKKRSRSKSPSRSRAKKSKKTSKQQEEDEEVPVWAYVIGGIFALALAAAVLFGIYSAVKVVLQFLTSHMWIVWAAGLLVLAVIGSLLSEGENPFSDSDYSDGETMCDFGLLGEVMDWLSYPKPKPDGSDIDPLDYMTDEEYEGWQRSSR